MGMDARTWTAGGAAQVADAASGSADDQVEAARLRALGRFDLTRAATDESLTRVARVSAQALAAASAGVMLVDRDTMWVKAAQAIPFDRLPRPQSFCTHTIQSRAALVVPDAAADPRFRELDIVRMPDGVRAYLGVPLATQDGFNIGALCVMDTRPRPDFGPGHAQTLHDLARIVVDGIEMRMTSRLDGLSGALSRQFFQAEAEREIGRANRYRRALSLILLDVDRFKSVNDALGHGAGDEVLAQLVARLRGQVRGQDLIGRLGGDEFAVLLPETGVDQATRVAGRLRRQIAATPMATRAGPVSVTISQGVVAYLTGIPPLEAILDRADIELYRAKRAGRDRVCVAFEQTLGGWSTLAAIH